MLIAGLLQNTNPPLLHIEDNPTYCPNLYFQPLVAH